MLMLLSSEVNLSEIAVELEREGYEVSLREGVLEAISPRGVPLELAVRGRELFAKTPDVGDRCFLEYAELKRALRFLDPKVLIIRGRVLRAMERSRGSTRRLAERLGLGVEAERSGYCG